MLSETYALKLPLPVEFIDIEQNFNYRYRCWDGEMIYLIGQMQTQLLGDTELILRSAR